MNKERKTALITGGSKGIGFATAKLFIENGYNVLITGRTGERLKEAVKKLESDRCAYILWDVADVNKAPEAINKAHSVFGNIDIFVNNAGIVHKEDMTGTDFLEKTEQAWDETMNINLKGMFFALQAQTKYMIEKGIKGHIVNVCSEVGFRAAFNAYRISKWGVRAMTMGIAKNISQYGIILNGVAPGETATSIFGDGMEDIAVKINSPRGERAMPSEIAETIYFLAHSKNIIGEIVVSDGGRSLY